MAAASGPSLFEIFEITSNDGQKTVSLIGGIITFQYFEDLLSPTITAQVSLINTGNTIDGQGVYNGLPIRGGERVYFRVKSPFDAASGNPTQLEYILYVNKVGNYISEKQKEMMTLYLVSREAIVNEQVRVTRKYKEQTIDKSASQILSLVSPTRVLPFEETQNKLSFIGNLRKPFTILTTLASRSIPVGAKSKSAGFFFWQTKNGFNFKSIDSLIKNIVEKKNIIATFNYSQILETSVTNDLANTRKILTFSVNSNTDIVGNLNKGEISTYRIYFNPLTFTFTESFYSSSSDQTLGHPEKYPLLADPQNISGNMLASRIISGILDVGGMNVGISTEINDDPLENVSQGISRYSSLFNQDLSLTVPISTYLSAGDGVKLQFPKVTDQEPEIDTELSGLYIIKEITHLFMPNNSYTAMRVVRDTHGLYGQK